MSRKKVSIYSDGACSGNPGPGGWAAILLYQGHRKEISGYAPSTTNQQMEIAGALEALKSLKQPCDVTVYSDSAYLVNAFRQGWLNRWRKNGWQTSDKRPVANRTLWEELLQAVEPHRVTWEKVAGHADTPENLRADELARAAVRKGK